MIYIKVCTELKKITAANKSFSSIRGVRAARGARRAMVGGASLLPTEERGELGGDVLGNSFSFHQHATWEFKYILLKEQSKTASISGLPTDCLHQQMRGEVQLRRFLVWILMFGDTVQCRELSVRAAGRHTTQDL